MKSVLVRIIRSRNPNFNFDPSIDNRILISFFAVTCTTFLRGLRLCFYGKRPKGMLLGRKVKFQYLHKFIYGKYVKIGSYVTIQALGKGGVVLGNNVSIGDFSKIVVSTTLDNVGMFIHIGDNVGMGEYAYIGGAGGLTIGNDCIIGQYFSCHPENHKYNIPDQLMRLQGVSREGIRIGNNCWIGSKVTILDGVEIGDNCVIAAGAVVTRSIESNSVVGGVPAKKLKSISTQIL